MLFISHAGPDAGVAERIVAFLEGRGVRCWLSSRDIAPQGVYAESITEGMRQSSTCLVILSAAANASDGVKREVELASHYRKPLMAVRIEDAEPSSGLDYYLRNVQWLDYHRHGEKCLDRIVQQISPAAGRDELLKAPPSEPSIKPSPRLPREGGVSQPVLWIGVSAVAVITLILIAQPWRGANPASYPPEYERNFAAACQARAASSSDEVCGCVWDRIEAEIPPSDFAALERLPAANREAHPLSAQINGYIEACSVEITPPATIAPGDEVPAP